MGDIATIWDVSNGRGDWQLAGPLLASGSDLQTAVLISLFTDRVVYANEIPDGSGDPRGWWGDAGEPYLIGSRLWLLARAKATQANLNNAHDYCKEALQWMVDDGVCASFTVFCQYTRPTMLGILISIVKNDGTTDSYQFDWAWDQLTSPPIYQPGQTYPAPSDPYAAIWAALGLYPAYDEGIIVANTAPLADEGIITAGAFTIYDEGLAAPGGA